jgi:insecticidal toxin complex protein TccC
MPPRWSLTGYLNNSSIEKKVLIVGCGTTPGNVTMGAGQTAMAGKACSLKSLHSKHFTIDISEDAGADFAANLLQTPSITQSNLSELIMFQTQGFRKFDEVIFEYLSKGLPGRNRDNVFSFSEIRTGIVSAHNLLKVGGKITFYNGSATYRNMALGAMNTLGYESVADKTENGHKYCEGTKKHL